MKKHTRSKKNEMFQKRCRLCKHVYITSIPPRLDISVCGKCLMKRIIENDKNTKREIHL